MPHLATLKIDWVNRTVTVDGLGGEGTPVVPYEEAHAFLQPDLETLLPLALGDETRYAVVVWDDQYPPQLSLLGLEELEAEDPDVFDD